MISTQEQASKIDSRATFFPEKLIAYHVSQVTRFWSSYTISFHDSFLTNFAFQTITVHFEFFRTDSRQFLQPGRTNTSIFHCSSGNAIIRKNWTLSLPFHRKKQSGPYLLFFLLDNSSISSTEEILISFPCVYATNNLILSEIPSLELYISVIYQSSNKNRNFRRYKKFRSNFSWLSKWKTCTK